MFVVGIKLLREGEDNRLADQRQRGPFAGRLLGLRHALGRHVLDLARYLLQQKFEPAAEIRTGRAFLERDP
jgi:hypothetical protein